LIGDDHIPKTGVLQPRQRVGHAGEELHLLRVGVIRHVRDQCAIAVDESRRRKRRTHEGVQDE
jgi:hypothetical protein